MIRYFVDTNGDYIGGYEGAEPPEGAIEIAAPPEHAADKMVGGVWVKAPQPPDLITFNALFLQGYIEDIFTQSQLIDAELAQKITDEQYRNAWLRGLIGNGSPEQQKRLFEIAEACNIPLPKI